MKKISEQLPSVFNVAAYFVEGNLVKGYGDRIAFYYQNKTFTYQTVHDNVQRAARLFSALGLERENRIAILLPDSPEFVFAFWGAIWLGAVPVPINTTCTVNDIQYMVQDSRAKILLTTGEWQKKLEYIESHFLRCVLLADGENPFLSLLNQQTKEPLAFAETSRDEPAFWLYTSGSTGRPKGVVHIHQSMVVCAELYGKATLGLHKDDVIYSVAKMPFAYGLGNTLYMPMAVGAAAVLSDATNAFDIINDIHRYQPSLFFGIPNIYANILAIVDISPIDTSSLRLCISAAEQLPKSIWNKWREMTGMEICEGIGTSEFLHIFLSNRQGECCPGSCGKPVVGYDVRVVDDGGSTVAPYEIGNLQVSGESLMQLYWNRQQQTRKVIYGETMRTGDKYMCDADGYFWFMGRKDDLFKIHGKWVSPFEIEDVLLQHESILDAAVVPDSDGGEHLTQAIAYVSLKPGFENSAELAERVRTFVKSQLPHFKTPKSIHIVDKLPRTSTGKIHRKALLKVHHLV
jgi:benzoate-CoA ligase family protein